MTQIQTALAADITLHSLEQATAESPRARRNLLIGLWAGRRLGLPEAELPRTESLSDTVARIMPYWKCEILPALAHHDAILVVAHGNSLRGIIKHLKGISDEAISEFNLPTAVPYVFEFDEGLNYAGDHFLGDPDEIARLMAAVANQGKKS